MKATVNAASLKQAVSWVSKVVKAHATLPILEYLMLSAPLGRLTVKATDLNMTLARHISANVQEAGDVLIKAKELKDYLKGTKDATLTLESAPVLKTIVSTDKVSMTFFGVSPDEFPLGLSNATWHDSFAFDPEAVNLKQIAKFADHDPNSNRIVLKCVLVEVYNGEDYRYKLTTADGFRLVSTNAIPADVVPIASKPNASYLLPAKAAEMMHSLKSKGVLAFGSREYENGPTVDYAQFSTDGSTVVSRLEEGDFPDYNQIIPANDRGTWASFDTAQLKAALEAMVAVSGKHNLTTLSLSGTKAMLSATSEDGNELETSLEVDWTGEELVIGFNAKYLLDCLPLCGERTRIMLENPSRPLTIKGTDSVMVVMPIHVKP